MKWAPTFIVRALLKLMICSNNMIGKVKQTIEKHDLLQEGDTVVVALSGGADSCALLYVMADLAKKYRLKNIVAHFNHGLRGEESEADESFCRNLTQEYGFAFVTEKMPQSSIPKGLSPEDYFRRERYRFLNQVAIEYQANKIALGHHLNDQAETVLLNILRGSGLDGLKGFLPARGHRYIRPLMEITRREIDEVMSQKGLASRHDSSNESSAYLRNSIRLELIPYLKEKYNPRIEQSLSRMAEIVRMDDDYLNSFVRDIKASVHIRKDTDCVSFSSQYFATLPSAIGMRLIKSLLEDLTPDRIGFSHSHIQAAADLILKQKTGKRIFLPFGLQVRQQYDRILIGRTSIQNTPHYEYSLLIPGALDLKERCMILSVRRTTVHEVDFNNPGRIYMDADRLKEPLVIRNRRSGDWFEPLGTKGKQKIKKLLIDRKVPGCMRDTLALLVDRESVIWIENMHLSERVKISPQTKHVLVMEIKKKLSTERSM